LRALELLASYPVVTAKRLAARLDPGGTHRDRTTRASGRLQEKTGYACNRVFVATEVLAIINRPFGDKPILHG
jgi:hypothetical protein